MAHQPLPSADVGVKTGVPENGPAVFWPLSNTSNFSWEVSFSSHSFSPFLSFFFFFFFSLPALFSSSPSLATAASALGGFSPPFPFPLSSASLLKDDSSSSSPRPSRRDSSATLLGPPSNPSSREHASTSSQSPTGHNCLCTGELRLSSPLRLQRSP